MRFSLINANFSKKTVLTLNILSSILSFSLTLCVNFFVSPYIVANLGAEANGYNTLAANFISYAEIIKVALNSMGARFIALSYHRGDKEKAEKYYNAMFFGNLFLSIVFTIAAIIIVTNIEHIINISPELVKDVKILFTLIFSNSIINTATSVLLTATFVTNKIYLDKIREVQGVLLKIAVIATCFGLLDPKIYYVALGSLCATVLTNIYSLYYKKKLLPEIKASRKRFNKQYIKEIIASGIWNSILQAASLLFDSFDLLITNWFISPLEMGVLSIAKTVPNMISGLNSTVQGVFTPALVGEYAVSDAQSVANSVKKNARIIIGIITIPLCFLIVFGSDFYRIWQPTQDASRLQIISILSCGSIAITACAMSVYNVFIVLNRVKESSIATLITGAVSLGVTYFLVKNTDLGIYAVAGVSSVMYMLRSLLFALPMSAKYLGVKKSTFFTLIPLNVLSVVILCCFGFLERLVVPHNTWLGLLVSALIFVVVSALLNGLLLFKKSELISIFKQIKKRFKKNENKTID